MRTEPIGDSYHWGFRDTDLYPGVLGVHGVFGRHFEIGIRRELAWTTYAQVESRQSSTQRTL